MIFSRLLKGRKSTTWVTVLACLGFVVGCIYMYQVPLSTVGSQLTMLFLLLFVVVGAAFLLAITIVLLKKIFRCLFEK